MSIIFFRNGKQAYSVAEPLPTGYNTVMMKSIYKTVFFALAVSLFCQDVMVDAFIENFNKGSDETKIEVLRDSSGYGVESMGKLYLAALDYVLNNADKLDLNIYLRRIGILSARLIGSAGYSEAEPTLWALFRADMNTGVRISILHTLKDIATDESAVVQRLNNWVDTQNNVFKAGGGVDAQVLSEALRTLGSFGSPSSFSVILTSSVLGIHSEVTSAAREALLNIEGNVPQMISDVIENAPVEEKVVALQTGRGREGISQENLAQLAHKALRIGVYTSASAQKDKNMLRSLRMLAVDILSESNWGEATQEMIQHFNLTIEEYDRGAAVKGDLLEAVKGLGSMGTLEAALRLGVYLDITNSYVEGGEPYDEQLVLAVVRNLGYLGSKETLQGLLYVRYLNYSKPIKDAAQEAILAIRTR